MKIEHRLNHFGFLEQALKEFEYTSLERDYYRLKGYEYNEEDFETVEIFTPPNLEEYIKQIPHRKAQQVISTIRDVLEKATSNKCQLYFSIAKNYFTNYEEVADFNPDMKDFSTLDEDDKLMFWYDQIVKIGSLFDYYPHRQYSLQLINAMDLKAANPAEDSYFQNKEYSLIMTLRDILFVSYLFDDSVVINNQVPDDFELSCRKILKTIFFEHYPSQIVQYNEIFVGFIDSIKKIVDEKMEILIRRKERAIYIDEWGTENSEHWDRDLKSFSRKVVLPSIFFPQFVLYLNIESLLYDYINAQISFKNFHHVIINYDLSSDFSDLLDRISRASSKAIEEMEVDILSAIVGFIVNVRQTESQATDKIGDSSSSFGFENVENQQTMSAYENGIDFEHYVRTKLEGIGFTVIQTPITGDQGADIIATRDGKRYAIQCKSYSGQVGNAAVQEVIAGKIFYDCDFACVVTNSNFTPSAYQLAAKAGVIMCANENLEPLN